MAANGIELMSTKLITPAVVTCGNGNAGIRFPSTKTREKFGARPCRLMEADAGEVLIPAVGVGPKLAPGESKGCSTSVTGLSPCFAIKNCYKGVTGWGAFPKTRVK